MISSKNDSLKKRIFIAWTEILYDEGMIDKAKRSRMIESFSKINE